MVSEKWPLDQIQPLWKLLDFARPRMNLAWFCYFKQDYIEELYRSYFYFAGHSQRTGHQSFTVTADYSLFYFHVIKQQAITWANVGQLCDALLDLNEIPRLSFIFVISFQLLFGVEACQGRGMAYQDILAQGPYMRALGWLGDCSLNKSRESENSGDASEISEAAPESCQASTCWTPLI